MGCPDYNILLQFVGGQLKGGPENEVQNHLDTCGTCFEVTVELAKDFPKEEEPIADTDDTMVHDAPPEGTSPSQVFAKTRGAQQRVRGPGDAATSQTVFRTGEDVGQFRIMRLIAEGGMGQLYLARDLQLGRKVALKVIHPELFESERVVSRFIYEAQMTARFSHPHIVTIYQVGTHKSILYVALEYLEGQDLKERCSDQPLTLPEILRICMAVGSAVSEAHSHGVLHRDLKPANILIPKDGRVRVVDFGLAHQVDTEEPKQKVLLGTPAYMAPEQWRGESCTKATDVWALGLILYELCADRLPLSRLPVRQIREKVCNNDILPSIEEFADVPSEIAELTKACLIKDPIKRPSAEQFVESIREVLFADSRTTSHEDIPFRGLLPFTERHANFFFGRETETTELVERIRQEPILAVVGPSGAGKSSFVQAGVLPRLRESDRWIVLRLRPGEQPIERLAAKILAARAEETGSGLMETSKDVSASSTVRTSQTAHNAAEIQRLADSIRTQPRQLSLELHELAEQRQGKILLIVDQLEELVTLVRNDEIERNFLDAICLAADDASDPVRVIVTIRDDFLGRVSRLGEAVRRILTHMVVLSTPNSETLKETLTRPLESIGYTFDDPTIVDDMVSSVDALACLPLLQFTARSMWDQRDRVARKLRRADYEQLGGVAGALAQHADTVLHGLSANELGLTRKLLLRLVTQEKTKKALSMAKLIDGLSAEAETVVNRLTNSRLITIRKTSGESDSEAQLELAHESLIHTWEMLSKWVEEGQEEIALLNEIGQAADLWVKRGRRESEVWDDVTASFGRDRLGRASIELPANVLEFLNAAKDKKIRQTRRRRNATIATIAILICVACVLGFQKQEAEKQSKIARQEKKLAEAQRAEALIESAASSLNHESEFEARAKLRSALEKSDSPPMNTSKLWRQIRRSPHLWKKNFGGPLYSATFSPDGRKIALGSLQGLVHIIDSATQATFTLDGPKDQVVNTTFSADGTHIASSSVQPVIHLWNVESRELVAELQSGHPAQEVSFSPNGNLLAAATSNGTLEVWNLATQKLERTIKAHVGTANCIRFDAKGEILASSGTDGTIKTWNATTGELLQTLRGHEGSVGAIEFSPDGLTLASLGNDSRINLWDFASGIKRDTFTNSKFSRDTFTFSPSGKHLAIPTNHNSILFQEISPWRAVAELKGHDGAIQGVNFSPDGKTLVSAGFDSTAHLWNISNLGSPRALEGHKAPVYTLQFSPDGKWIASGSLDKAESLRLWDSKNGNVISKFGPISQHQTVAFSPDNQRLASGGASKGIRIWSLNDFSSQLELGKDVIHNVEGLRFTRDGNSLISADGDGIRLWDSQKGNLLKRANHPRGIFGLHYFNKDRGLAAGDSAGNITIWNGTSLKLKKELKGHTEPVINIAVSPDGKRIYSAGLDGKVLQWDTNKETSQLLLTHKHRINWINKHPNREVLGIASSDGTATILDLSTNQKTLLSGHQSEVNSIEFAGNSDLVATGSDDGTVRLWNYKTGNPFWKTTALIHSPAAIRTHRGWQDVAPNQSVNKAIKEYIDTHAQTVQQTGDGKLLCLATKSGYLELWENNGQFVSKFPLEARVRLLPLRSHCAILDGNSIELVPLKGSPIKIVLKAAITAASSSATTLFVATGKTLHTFKTDGSALATYTLSSEASALHAIGGTTNKNDSLIVGHRDGNININEVASDVLRLKLSFNASTPSSVVNIAQGPENTTVAAYANGELVFLDNQKRAILDKTRLHGSPDFLAIADEKILASTNLGYSAVIDLKEFYQSRCEMLADVWKEIPAVWENGKVVLRPLPLSHPCAPQPETL